MSDGKSFIRQKPIKTFVSTFLLLGMSDDDDGRGSDPTSLEMGSKAQD